MTSGGLGLIVLADGITPDPAVANFTPLASGGRNQLKVRGVGAWDAIKTFQQFGIRAPISPLKASEPDVLVGRALFASANCLGCHGGPQWTGSRVNFTPPPGAGVTITAGQVIDQLRPVGTFDATSFNEVRANALAPLGAAGFVPPSLLSLHVFPQVFLHNGGAASLAQVLNNISHRSAGTSGVDALSNAADRARLEKFLRRSTHRPCPSRAEPGGQQGVLSSAAVGTGWLLLITALHWQRFDLAQMQTGYWPGGCRALGRARPACSAV